jgi:hypothetical protein
MAKRLAASCLIFRRSLGHVVARALGRFYRMWAVRESVGCGAFIGKQAGRGGF